MGAVLERGRRERMKLESLGHLYSQGIVVVSARLENLSRSREAKYDDEVNDLEIRKELESCE